MAANCRIHPRFTEDSGDRGFTDVWWDGKFGWEYKRQGKYDSLDDVYRQLCQCREALNNPPRLIVNDTASTVFDGVHPLKGACLYSP